MRSKNPCTCGGWSLSLEHLKNSEALASWVHGALPLKNQLSTEDAQAVENAFTARLSQLE
jgi:hypothetical protein